MDKAEKLLKTYGKNKSVLWLSCKEPECAQSKKTYKGPRGLALHMSRKHGKRLQYNVSIQEIIKAEDKMSKEIPVKSVSDATNMKTITAVNDITDLSKKVSELSAMIPTNFCKEFPNLCTLGKRIDNLESNITKLSEKIPKSIKVSLPKVEDNKKFEFDTSKLISTLTTNIHEELQNNKNNSNIDIKDINKLISEEINPLSSALQNIISENVKTKEELLNKLNKDPEKVVVEKEVEKLIHNDVTDYLNCPECRKKLITKLSENITTTDEDIEEFSALYKVLQEHMNKGKVDDARKQSPRSDKNIAESSNIRESEPKISTTTDTRTTTEPTKTKSNSEPEEQDTGIHQDIPNTGANSQSTGTEATTSGKEEKECTKSWCLFR